MGGERTCPVRRTSNCKQKLNPIHHTCCHSNVKLKIHKMIIKIVQSSKQDSILFMKMLHAVTIRWPILEFHLRSLNTCTCETHKICFIHQYLATLLKLFNEIQKTLASKMKSTWEKSSGLVTLSGMCLSSSSS